MTALQVIKAITGMVRRLLLSWRIALLSLLIAAYLSTLWDRKGTMATDEMEFVCYFGVGVCSFEDRVYVSAFRQPSWRFRLHPDAFVHATSSFRESSAFFNYVVMQEYGTSNGTFGFVASRLDKESSPAARYPVIILMLPHWPLVALFAILPLFHGTAMVARLRNAKRSPHVDSGESTSA